MKYFIIAQPKSGIHLCGNLFKELGIISSNYLLRKKKLLKYNKYTWNAQMDSLNWSIVYNKGWPIMLDVLPNDTSIDAYSYIQMSYITRLRTIKLYI